MLFAISETRVPGMLELSDMFACRALRRMLPVVVD
jgi:hypothetical protein